MKEAYATMIYDTTCWTLASYPGSSTCSFSTWGGTWVRGYWTLQTDTDWQTCIKYIASNQLSFGEFSDGKSVFKLHNIPWFSIVNWHTSTAAEILCHPLHILQHNNFGVKIGSQNEKKMLMNKTIGAHPCIKHIHM